MEISHSNWEADEYTLIAEGIYPSYCKFVIFITYIQGDSIYMDKFLHPTSIICPSHSNQTTNSHLRQSLFDAISKCSKPNVSKNCHWAKSDFLLPTYHIGHATMHIESPCIHKINHKRRRISKPLKHMLSEWTCLTYSSLLGTNTIHLPHLWASAVHVFCYLALHIRLMPTVKWTRNNC